jgi:hypothetical protein
MKIDCHMRLFGENRRIDTTALFGVRMNVGL